MVSILLSDNYSPEEIEIEENTSVREVLNTLDNQVEEDDPLRGRLDNILYAFSNGVSKGITAIVDGYPVSVGAMGTVKPSSLIVFQGKSENGLN